MSENIEEKAKEMRMCVRSFGPNLSRAVNLHHSRSEINQSTQGAIREHLEDTHRAIRE